MAQVLFECIETRGPEGPIRCQPVIDLLERMGPQPINPTLRIHTRLNQARVAQDAEVLGDRGLAHRQSVDQLSDRPLAGAEKVEDPPAVRFRQDLERSRHEPSMP